MSLSIEKLNTICENNGLVPLKYFTYKGNLLFLQTISIKKGFSFMINIPKKFSFDNDLRNLDSVYKLKKIKIDKDDLKNPYKSPDNSELDKMYSEIKVAKEFDPTINVDEMEKKLLETYNKQIYVSNMDKEEFYMLRDIFRQIQRLKLCVQGIDYKISIIYKNYLCSIDEGDEIECYKIRHFKTGFYRKLFISLSLNLLFNNINNLEEHLQQVFDGVNDILIRSQESHYDKFLKTVESCKLIETKMNHIRDLRQQINENIINFERMLNKVVEYQKKIHTEIKALKNSDSVDSNLNFMREKMRLDKSNEELDEIKLKIMEKLVSLRDKDSDASLKVDKVLFDNIIMLNNVINNLKIFDDK